MKATNLNTRSVPGDGTKKAWLGVEQWLSVVVCLRQAALVLLLTWGSPAFPRSVAGASPLGDLTVQGVIQVARPLRLNGAMEQKQDYEFEWQSTDGKWSIDLVPKIGAGRPSPNLPPHLSAPLPRAKIVFDGALIWSVMGVTESSEPTPNGTPSGAPADVGAISAGPVPFGLIPDAAIAIWYAFGSFDYLSTVSDGIVNPFRTFAFEYENQKREANARWELIPNTKLPNLILVSNDFANHHEEQVPAVFRNAGFDHTNVVFRTTAVTNFGDLTIPALVSVDYYSHVINADSHKVFKVQQLSLQVEKVDHSTKTVMERPAIARPTEIHDQRYWRSNPPVFLRLLATNSWPMEAALQPAYLARRDYLARQQRQAVGLKGYIVGVIILTTVIGVCWRYRTRSARR